jgi:Kef-type K+ transport system membrane component KefB
MAGLEVKFDEVKKYTYAASVLAVMGGIASFLLGFAVGMIFFNDFLTAFAIGVVLISTRPRNRARTVRRIARDDGPRQGT